MIPRSSRSKFLQLAALGGGVTLLAAAFVPGASSGDPCCNVLSVDRAAGVVTAFDRASGNRFSFSVKDKALLSGIKPCQAFDTDLAGLKDGQAFAADFGTAATAKPNLKPSAAGRARVNPTEPCCTMTSAPGTAGRVLGAQPHAKHEGVEILLLNVERSRGDLVTATCLYCNRGSESADLSGDMRDRAYEAKLLDTENKVAYQVERAGGVLLLSDHGSGLHLKPGQSARTWIKFTAPKGEAATLVVPGASEPFEDVAIAAAKP
jgi:hypothetical protein